MLACANAEALAATLATGEVHFLSRSRQRLWRKGETSGNVLHLRGLALDCDGDALLATVEPAGPTCHRGTRSCFDPDDAPPDGRSAEPATASGTPSPAIQGFAWLETLWATITATEVLMAAKDDAVAEASGGDRTALRDALAGEAADLLYHALVLLAERGIPPSAVIERLRQRHAG